jgi:hypothetical protein
MSIRGLACAASIMCALDLSAAPSSASTQIMVAQCLQFSACYLDTTPWGDTLSQSQLESFGLGTTIDLVVTQTSQLVIQLGKTTAVFSTSGAEVIETIDQFTGPGFYPDPGPFPSGLLVGTLAIPADATGLTITGAFGNSIDPTSSGANVCLGSGRCGAAALEPSGWAMLLLGFVGLGFLGRRRLRLAVAA